MKSESIQAGKDYRRKKLEGTKCAERGHSNAEKYHAIYPLDTLQLRYETQGSPALTWKPRTLAYFHNYYGKREWAKMSQCKTLAAKTS